MDQLRWTMGLSWLALVGVGAALHLQPEPPERTAPVPAAVKAREAPVEPPTAAPSNALFDPKPNPPIRRLPSRPSVCTMAPPPGRWTMRAVLAARSDDCAEALVAVSQAMDVSPDHCPLYKDAWKCFLGETEILRRSRAETFEDFVALLPHFEGRERPGIRGPALDGLEFALEAWEADPELRTQLGGLFGTPTVADHLTMMLELEVAAAEGLARAAEDDPRPEIVGAWARRVYVLARALSGPVGVLMNQHRPKAFEDVRDRLEAIREGRVGPVPPPPEVMQALAAGEAR
jgi:hypothetical protein